MHCTLQRFFYDELVRPKTSEDKDIDLVAFWERKKEIFPKLYQLAIKYCIIMPSSVPCESQFSQAKNLITCKRQRLSDGSIRATIILSLEQVGHSRSAVCWEL